ncbi:unnamed protein product, partial [marine sediment metagenome]
CIAQFVISDQCPGPLKKSILELPFFSTFPLNPGNHKGGY